MKKNTEHVIMRARKEYAIIKCVTCPALENEKVYFDDAGLRHLLYKGKRRRLPQDQIRRLYILRYATEIIVSSEIIECRKIKGRNGMNITFWSLARNIGQRQITVILRQIESGRKHFYSIMSRKTKAP